MSKPGDPDGDRDEEQQRGDGRRPGDSDVRAQRRERVDGAQHEVHVQVNRLQSG